MLIKEELYKRILEKKKRLDSLRPLPKIALQRLKERFEVEATYNSNAIEGNSLTLRETQLVLERGLTISGKSLREHFEVTNHREAMRAIETIAAKMISEDSIKQIHKLILKGIWDEEAGKYRKENVRITGAIRTPPQWEKVNTLMRKFVEHINKNSDSLNKVELAGMLHYNFVAIHPFADGNGRTARLLMNLFLMKNGFPPTMILNAERKWYYNVLRSADSGDIKYVLDFIAKAVERGLDMYLEVFASIEYISLADAAKGSPFSQEYLSLLARSGKLDAVKFGRNWLTTKAAVKNYIRKHGRR